MRLGLIVDFAMYNFAIYRAAGQTAYGGAVGLRHVVERLPQLLCLVSGSLTRNRKVGRICVRHHAPFTNHLCRVAIGVSAVVVLSPPVTPARPRPTLVHCPCTHDLVWTITEVGFQQHVIMIVPRDYSDGLLSRGNLSLRELPVDGIGTLRRAADAEGGALGCVFG